MNNEILQSLENAIQEEIFIAYENRFKYFDIDLSPDEKSIHIMYESQDGNNQDVIDDLRITIDQILSESDISDILNNGGDITATVWNRNNRSDTLTQVLVSDDYKPTTMAGDFNEIVCCIMEKDGVIKYRLSEPGHPSNGWLRMPANVDQWASILATNMFGEEIRSVKDIEDFAYYIGSEANDFHDFVIDSWNYVDWLGANH